MIRFGEQHTCSQLAPCSPSMGVHTFFQSDVEVSVYVQDSVCTCPSGQPQRCEPANDLSIPPASESFFYVLDW